jgi:DNA helicase TIP49 (TBP-interacting protein)
MLDRAEQRKLDAKKAKESSVSKELQPLYDEAKKFKTADEFAKKIFDKELKEGDIVYYKDSMNNIAKAKYQGKN